MIEIDKEKEEKALLEEIKVLEKDKEQFFQKRKEQNDILDKYMDLLKSLQTKNEITDLFADALVQFIAAVEQEEKEKKSA